MRAVLCHGWGALEDLTLGDVSVPKDLMRWCGEGKLRPCVTHRLPLPRSVEAIRLLTERKAHGKVVVVLEAP